MSTSKSFTRSISNAFRRFFARPAEELSRTGKIAQTLYDATRLQQQRLQFLQKIGEIAVQHTKEGKISDLQIDRLIIKIENIDKLLQREEHLIRQFQSKSDMKKKPAALSEEDDADEHLEETL
ncbi:MAG: hypothetical protein KA116_02360 [Proteobacteria bacterium]|jgi:hypothetical protein|nr:hypothetical protein [Pseudomonadota bacterium]